MTGTLKVDTKSLTKAANSFKTTGSQIQKLTQNMMDTVNKLTGNVWSGDAAKAYTTQFKGLQDDMQRMHRMINEHVSDLTAMAKEYEQSEQKNQHLAKALAKDVIK